MATLWKFIKTLIVYVISAMQTVTGIFIWMAVIDPTSMNNKAESVFDVNGFIPAVIILVVLSGIVMAIRCGNPFITIVEFVISPIALLRSLISLILWIAKREMPELEYGYCYDTKDMIKCYLFYFE